VCVYFVFLCVRSFSTRGRGCTVVVRNNLWHGKIWTDAGWLLATTKERIAPEVVKSHFVDEGYAALISTSSVDGKTPESLVSDCTFLPSR
jgi:hypothetical protein